MSKDPQEHEPLPESGLLKGSTLREYISSIVQINTPGISQLQGHVVQLCSYSTELSTSYFLNLSLLPRVKCAAPLETSGDRCARNDSSVAQNSVSLRLSHWGCVSCCGRRRGQNFDEVESTMLAPRRTYIKIGYLPCPWVSVAWTGSVPLFSGLN